MNTGTDIYSTGVAKFAPGIACLLGAATIAGSFSFADETADSFDPPIKQTSVDLGPSPQYEDPKIRSVLTCYYYAHVMIKEYDEGGPSAGLSMLHIRGNLPECRPERQRGERIIDSSEWIGILKGVKDTLVFFDPGEDFNGDSPFAVFDSVSGSKIFQDSAYGEYVSSQDYRTGRVRVITSQGGYVLKYLRVREAGCDLHLDGGACWGKVKGEFDLESDRMPVCTGYEHISEIWGTDHVESWIAYPVEVDLLPRPTVKNVAGAVLCWPAQ